MQSKYSTNLDVEAPEEVRTRVDQYLTFYNEERIQTKLGYLTPYEYGRQAA